MKLETKKHDPYATLRIKEFCFFITARFALTLAIQMQGVIVGWQIYEKTRDPLSLGFIGLAEAIPFIAVALFAGHIADIIDRKKIIMIASTFLVLSSAALLYFSLDFSNVLDNFGTFPIYCVIFFTGIARSFLGPSYFAFVTQIVPRDLYANATMWNTTLWHAAAVAGPALAGMVYGFLGIGVAYSVVVILILCSMFFVGIIAKRGLPPKENKESLWQSLSVGIKFVFRNEVILGALSLDLFAVFFGGAVALLPMFADQVLHTGPEGLGLLRAAPALGAVIMAVAMAYFPPTRNAGRNLLLAVSAFGLCTVLFALSYNFFLSFFLLALAGAFDNVSVVVRHTILQLMTPENMRGRVSSVNNIFIGSSNEIGAMESGLAARLMGLIPSVIFGGCMTMLVVGATAKLAPRLRNLNLNAMK